MDAFARARVDECELKSMQHHPGCCETYQVLKLSVLPLPIRQIAHKRKTEVLEMHSDLVSAPGVQFDRGKSGRAQPLQHAITRSRFTATVVTDRHSFAVGRMARNRGANLALIPRHFTTHERVINLFHLATGKL